MDDGTGDESFPVIAARAFSEISRRRLQQLRISADGHAWNRGDEPWPGCQRSRRVRTKESGHGEKYGDRTAGSGGVAEAGKDQTARREITTGICDRKYSRQPARRPDTGAGDHANLGKGH